MSSSKFEKFQATRESGDGVSYMYIDLPKKGSLSLQYNTADHVGNEDLEEDYEIHHVYIDCQEIAEKGFPLDANPREPAKTRQVKAMDRTLENSPHDFVKKNNGVVVICSSIESNDSGISIEFSDGEGICNGGHTYFAIMTADKVLDDARLHLEILTIPGLSKEDRKAVITDIAKARNNSNQLERRSEADFLGYYQPFQDTLEYPELVEWHENDSKANSEAHPISAVQFLRLLKSIDIKAYQHPLYNEDANSHKSLATSRSRFHNSWIKKVEQAQDDDEIDPPLEYLIPLANDVMFLRDVLSYSFPQRDTQQAHLGTFRKTRLYKDYIMNENSDGEPTRQFRQLLTGDFGKNKGVNLPSTLDVLFVGLFRSNVFWSSGTHEDSDPYIGWIMDPEELWKQRASDVLENMGELFSDLDKDPKQFIRINAPFNFDLYEFGMDTNVRPPSHLYDYDRNHFTKVESVDTADYWMKESGEPTEVTLKSVDDQEVPPRAALYSVTTE